MILGGSGGEIYTVFDEESESEVENLEILHPDLEIHEKQRIPRNDDFSLFSYFREKIWEFSGKLPGKFLELSDKVPLILRKCSVKCPENVWEISWKNPDLFPGNFREMSRKFPGNVQDVFEISWKCPGNVREISGKFLGIVRENSWKFPGNFREISGKFPEMSGKIPGKFRD